MAKVHSQQAANIEFNSNISMNDGDDFELFFNKLTFPNGATLASTTSVGCMLPTMCTKKAAATVAEEEA